MIKDLIIYILFIIIIIIHIKKESFGNSIKKESFVNTTDFTLSDFIEYDKKSINNILNFTKKVVLNSDKYNINKHIIVNNMQVNNDMTIDGKCIIRNQISYNFNLDATNQTKLLELLPRFSIINFNSDTAILPKRWVECDGKIWYLHKEDPQKDTYTDTTQSIDRNIRLNPPLELSNYEIISVPDLRGRFLLGSDSSNEKYDFSKIGGTDKVILESNHLPNHYHPSFFINNPKDDDVNFELNNKKVFDIKNKVWVDVDWDDRKFADFAYILDTSKYGNFGYENGNYKGALAHENMPPFLVTRYIMKI